MPWEAPRTAVTTLRVAAAMLSAEEGGWLCLHDSPSDCDQGIDAECSARVTYEEIAAELVALVEEPHYVSFRPRDAHVIHPIECRPHLATCEVWRAVRSLSGPPSDVLLGGMYPVRLEGAALVMGAVGRERVIAHLDAAAPEPGDPSEGVPV